VVDTIIRNARLLKQEIPVDIFITGERIERIAGENVPASTQIDAWGCLVLPGLVNPHAHLDKAGLATRVVNQSGTILEARQRVLQAKPGITTEDILLRASKVILTSLKGGVTAIRTHVDVDPTIGLKGIEALLELKRKISDLIDLQIVAFPQEGISESPGTLELLREALRMGADVVGGHLSIAKDFLEHCRIVFSLAKEFDKDVDFHVDFDIDRDYQKQSIHADGMKYPDELGIVWLIEEADQQNYSRRTNASHLCGLDSISPDDANRIISLIAKLGISVVSLPPGNLFLHGRSDPNRIRRGVTKVKALLDAGVCTSFGPDNIRDPFNPIGSPSMILNAVLTAYACHMKSPDDFNAVFEMCTVNAAKILRLPNYGIAPGCYADLIILDSDSPEEILANPGNPRYVFKRGRLIAESGILTTPEASFSANK
jgi:cytosine deaminase